jgi:predicted nucleic acid-binding protein
MTGPAFVDSNIWLYARDPGQPAKQPLARRWLDRLWDEGAGRTSVQVLNEFYVNATRRLAAPLTPAEAWTDVLAMLAWRPQALDEPVIRGAREIEQRYRLGWWDSLIVSAAREQRCALLLTEALQHGQVIDGLRVCNPFIEGLAEPVGPFAVAPRPRRTRRTRMGPPPEPVPGRP